MVYTIIPDIHADLVRLDASLALAKGSVPVFLGDFIDANAKFLHGVPADRAVLARVKPMIEQGEALAVMGNHELNAILYHRRDAAGVPLRAHSEKNRKQHDSFLDAYGLETHEALTEGAWFLTHLPLFIDRPDLRVVHAFWDEALVTIIKERRPDGYLREEDLAEIGRESTEFGRAVKQITSGREASLPAPYAFHDFKGEARHEVRLAWWRDDQTWRSAALSVPDVNELPEGDLPPEWRAAAYPHSAPRVFAGHYKMEGAPALQHPRALCLDYPFAPCVYRWRGEQDLMPENLILLDLPALEPVS